ncbi:MAG: flagellar protein FlaG [Negativicutes bacterium]
MEVNLKAPQDAGANGYTTAMKQGGAAINGAAGAGKKNVDTRSQSSNVSWVKNPNETEPENAAHSETVLSKEELQTVTADLTKFMQSLNTDIEFSLHEKANRMMVRVVDSKTHDVLKEFPPEELLDTIGAIRDYVGALLDKKA